MYENMNKQNIPKMCLYKNNMPMLMFRFSLTIFHSPRCSG